MRKGTDRSVHYWAFLRNDQLRVGQSGQSPFSGDHGDVRDSADVQGNPRDTAVAEQQVIDVRDQGRALAAGGDVALAEIGDDADAGALGDDGGLADLERAGDAMTQIIDRTAFVKNGLAVHSAELD